MNNNSVRLYWCIPGYCEGQERILTVPCKQVLGPEFMWRSFVMAALLVTSKYGYPDFIYFAVVDERSGFPIGGGPSKAEALAQARRNVQGDRVGLTRLFADMERELLAKVAQEAREKDEEHRRLMAEQKDRVFPIDRKRQKIFDGSKGKCHYCETVLEIRGEWHVEHKVPKSRGGTNDYKNLVASCAPCNRAKHRLTDEEFIASRKTVE